jgi:hypothetical protein
MTALGATVAIAGAIACWASTPALAGTASTCSLYASNSGNDRNAGTRTAPFATLKKLLDSLAAGQTGCLESGQTFDNEPNSTGRGSLVVRAGETHGAEGAPVTITSTDPAHPATIGHSVSLLNGADWITFTHLIFRWAIPKPWACWNSEGNPFECPGEPTNPEDHVQIAVSSKHSSWTYNEVTSENTNICFNLTNYGGGYAEHTLIEHNVIHECGPPVVHGFPVVNEEWGWHAHGVYDYGRYTLIKNNYIYDNSRNGVVFYASGEGSVAEHNIIDHNGEGILFGSNKNETAQWNIITNSTSPRGSGDYGIGSFEPGPGNVATKNCLYNNASGELAAPGVTTSENKTHTNPLYADAVKHEYTLQSGSPCLGYGPDTVQPGAALPDTARPVAALPIDANRTTGTASSPQARGSEPTTSTSPSKQTSKSTAKHVRYPSGKGAVASRPKRSANRHRRHRRLRHVAKQRVRQARR